MPLILSAGAALLVTWWLAPTVANWLRLPPELPVADPVPLAALVGLLATVGAMLPVTLGAPAWNALRRPPATALQGRTASEGPWGRRVRQGLLGVQLGGALLLLALAGVLSLQQRHLLQVETGVLSPGLRILALQVAAASRRPLPAGKAVVGSAVFAHESGIHTKGVLATPGAYEPFPPEEVGGRRRLVLGKHAGRAGLRHVLRSSGIDVEEHELMPLLAAVREHHTAHKRPPRLADLRALVERVVRSQGSGDGAAPDNPARPQVA